MATITTTIKEPKTFQQIQDQKRELDKEEALETLNNNIAKLIKTINDKSEKKISDDERQLKANQLALSKLQLRRAQLGLAKDEKSYSDYSVKYNSTHGVGSSIGVSQNTRDNATAVALSAMTAGALNPVIVKEILLPPLKMMTRAVTGLGKALFSERRISGKTSSAVEGDSEKKLHKKLDDILGAIKTKTKSSPKEQQKKEGFFSKALGALAGLAGTVGRVLLSALKGAVGAYLAIKLGEKIAPFIESVLSNVVGEENAQTIVNTFKKHLPSMVAGYLITGTWRGALVGLGIDLLGTAMGIFTGDVASSEPDIVDKGTEYINQVLNGFGLSIEKSQFEGAVGGLILAGPKGMLLGFALGTPAVRDAIAKIRDGKYYELLTDAEDKINELKAGTPLEAVPVESIEGAILGGVIGSKFGFKGLLIGAILGAAGGFVWNRYKNANVPEQYGINTQFDPKTLNWNIAGLDKNWSQFEDEAKKDLKSKNEAITQESVRKRAAELINKELKAKGVDNKAKGFGEVISDTVMNQIKENPLTALGLAGGGLAALCLSTIGKILTSGIKFIGGFILKSIPTLFAGLTSFTKTVASIAESIVKNAGNLLKKGVKTLKDAAKGISNGVNKVKTGVKNGVEKIKSKIEKPIKENISEVKSAANDNVKPIKQKTAEPRTKVAVNDNVKPVKAKSSPKVAQVTTKSGKLFRVARVAGKAAGGAGLVLTIYDSAKKSWELVEDPQKAVEESEGAILDAYNGLTDGNWTWDDLGNAGQLAFGITDYATVAGDRIGDVAGDAIYYVDKGYHKTKNWVGEKYQGFKSFLGFGDNDDTVKISNTKNAAEVDRINKEKEERKENIEKYLKTISDDAEERMKERKDNKGKEPPKVIVENNGVRAENTNSKVNTGMSVVNE